MADRPTLDEFVIEAGGDPFNFAYIEAIAAALSQNYEDPATEDPSLVFAPPVPTLLPEVVVTPPKVPAPVIIETAPGLLTRIMPWFGLLVGMPGGGAGTGDAPDDPSTVTQRYADTPPPPPPPIEPTLTEPEPPPNWADIANRPGFYGDPIRTPGIPIPEVEMPFGEPEFVVEATRPAPAPTFDLFSNPLLPGSPYDFPGTFAYPADPGPGPAPAPIGTPGIDPAPGLPDPFTEPGIRVDPAPRPASPTAPDLFGAPLPDVVGDPIGDPFPAPDGAPGPSFEPGIPAPDARPGAPDYFAQPLIPDPFTFTPPDPVFSSPDPFNEPTPLIEFGPQPAGPKKDTCTCPKKKKKKKASDRSVCYRGTYKQNKRGITFTPKEQVPCEAKAKPVSKRETRSPGRRGSSRTPTWQDTLNDVFNFTT